MPNTSLGLLKGFLEWIKNNSKSKYSEFDVLEEIFLQRIEVFLSGHYASKKYEMGLSDLCKYLGNT